MDKQLMVRVHDKKYPNRLILYKDLDIQFNNREAELPEWFAYRLSRIKYDDDFIFENKIVPYNPDSWKKEKRLIWGGNVSTANGYGNVAFNIIKALLQLKTNPRTWGGLSGNPLSGARYVNKSVKNILGEDPFPDCIEIQHQQPPAFKHSIIQRRWCYSMFETTHTPRSWIKLLNKMEHVLVPSAWLVDSWKEQGVTVPIDVFPHGIDPTKYSYIERPEHEIYTFVQFCQLGERKGTDLLAQAFADEFAGVKDVQLVLKNVFPVNPINPRLKDKANIKFISATYSPRKMTTFLRNADCGVWPSRGEGFSLPPIEALATGLPIITTNWSGMVDYADPDDTLLLDYKMERSLAFDFHYKDYFETGEDSGYWASPNIETLRQKMRWAYQNRSKAKAMGKRASKRICANWTWKQQCKKLIDILDKYA